MEREFLEEIDAPLLREFGLSKAALGSPGDRIGGGAFEEEVGREKDKS